MTKAAREFKTGWLSTEMTSLVPADWGIDYTAPLVTAPKGSLEQVEVPPETKSFLYQAGLPSPWEVIGLHFDTLKQAVLPVPEASPHKIDNGVELPPLRYSQFYKIGHDGYDDDVCLAKYTGRVFLLDYGRKALRSRYIRLPDGSSTWNDANPAVFDIATDVGPHFLGSSVRQFAQLCLAFRDTFIGVGIKQKKADRAPRVLARLLTDKMRAIDEEACVSQESLWRFTLDMVGDGIF